MLCDALVVCTRAKNIAPKGLYDLLKHISCLEKQVFVVLAGWESIERNVAMAKARSERVSVEFEFARIMDVTCVFNTPCEGFSSWDNAFDSLAFHFSEKCEMLHHDQDERVRLVDQEELKSAIDKILKLIDLGDIDLAKAYFSALQEKYEVVATKAGELRNAVDHLKNYLKIIDGETI